MIRQLLCFLGIHRWCKCGGRLLKKRDIMKRLLCLIGLHSWATWRADFMLHRYCHRCGRYQSRISVLIWIVALCVPVFLHSAPAHCLAHVNSSASVTVKNVSILNKSVEMEKRFSFADTRNILFAEGAEHQPPIGPFEGCVPLWRLALGLLGVVSGYIVIFKGKARWTFWFGVCLSLGGTLIWLTGHIFCTAPAALLIP